MRYLVVRAFIDATTITQESCSLVVVAITASIAIVLVITTITSIIF
jgi:hypothetical protein